MEPGWLVARCAVGVSGREVWWRGGDACVVVVRLYALHLHASVVVWWWAGGPVLEAEAFVVENETLKFANYCGKTL
jgi:hypothetical protein